MSITPRRGHVRVPVLVGLLAAALAQPSAALAQDTPEPVPSPVASACLVADVAAAVGTDKPIYGNFETVTITGSGFAAECAVKVEVEDPNAQVAAYDATTDAAGRLSATHELADVDGTYVVRVRDAASDELLATTQFIDGLDLKALYDGDDEARIFDAGDTVTAKGTLDNKKLWRWIVRRPDGTIAEKTACAGRTTQGNEKVQRSFTLPANAPVTGENAWRFELHQYGDDSLFGYVIKSAESKCAEESGAQTDLLKFRVAKAVTSSDKPGNQAKYWFKPSERAWVSLRGLPTTSDWQVLWYKPDGTLSCDNVKGNLLSDGQPDVNGSGVLESLVYAPLTAGDSPFNRHDAYSKTTAGRCVDATTDGEWSVEVLGKERFPRGVIGASHDVSKRFKAFGIDGTKPTISASDVAGWHQSPVAVTLTAADALSGVAKVEWRKAGDSAWTTYAAAGKPELAHGEKLQFRATDVAGNVSDEGQTATAQVDGQTPVTSSDFDGGWHTAAQPIALTANANGPSATTIQWRKAAGDAWTTYDAATQPVLTHGESLQFRGIDAAGNEEAVNAVGPAKVDGEAPATADDVDGTVWSATAVVAALTVTDNGPAAFGATKWRKVGDTAWTTYDPTAKPTLGNGEAIEYFSTDEVPNTEAVKTSAAAKVDPDAPVTTATFSTDWSSGPVPVTLDASDAAGSGVDRIEYRKVGTLAWTTYDAAAKPSLADGEAFEFRAVDAVGNTEATKSTANAKVDTDAPTTTATLASGWQKTAVPVTLVATDAKSGVDAIEVRVAGTATWLPYVDAAKPVLTHGQALEFRATDEVGNTEVTKVTAPAQVDGQAPTTTDDVPASEVDGSTAVTLSAADAGPSGLAKVEWRKVGTTTWTVYAAGSKPVLAAGERLEYRATDAAGNVEAAKVSAALKVKAPTPEPVVGTDTNRTAPGFTAQSRTAALLPTVTNLTITPACMVGMTLQAPTAGRKAVTLSYVLGGGAKQVEITIQRRNPSAARTSCATTTNVRKPGAKYETVDQTKLVGNDGAGTSVIGSHDGGATARAASAKTVEKIVSRRAATAGRNQVTLAKLAAGQKLVPGTYRVLVVAIGAGGERSAPAKAIFRVAKG